MLSAPSPLASTWVVLPRPVTLPALLDRLMLPLACSEPTLMWRAVVRLMLPRVVRRSLRLTLAPTVALPSICRLRALSPRTRADSTSALTRVSGPTLSANSVRVLATTVDAVITLSLVSVSAS